VPASKSLPWTTKHKLASLLLTVHWRWGMPHKDPEFWLAVELGPRGHRLQEQFSGVPAWAQSQKQARSGCRLRPHQLLHGSMLALTKQK
jgi:hypothetical protein